MKVIFTEYNLSSFEDFHDKEWFRKTYNLVKGTEIESVAEEFTVHWYGSARAFILPWLLVNGVYDDINSIVPLPTSRQDLWSDYLKRSEFHAALWKLAENTYCSIYYAYENLVVNLLSKILGKNVRVTDRGFNSVLGKVYGDKFVGKIWNNNFVSMSREIRNCIVHNGGKASEKLLRMNLQPHIKDGGIMYSASDARQLYVELKPLAYELLQESLMKVRARK